MNGLGRILAARARNKRTSQAIRHYLHGLAEDPDGCTDCRAEADGIPAAQSTCAGCGLDVRLLGGVWTGPDGDTACMAGPASEYTSHIPQETVKSQRGEGSRK